MHISFTYRAKIFKSFSFDEVHEIQTLEEIVEYFEVFETDIACFFKQEVKALGVSGGCVSVKKLRDQDYLGFVASVSSDRKFNENELREISGEMTEQMNESYFGPDGFFIDIGEGGYYLLPVHPDFEISPIEIKQYENV